MPQVAPESTPVCGSSPIRRGPPAVHWAAPTAPVPCLGRPVGADFPHRTGAELRSPTGHWLPEAFDAVREPRTRPRNGARSQGRTCPLPGNEPCASCRYCSIHRPKQLDGTPRSLATAPCDRSPCIAKRTASTLNSRVYVLLDFSTTHLLGASSYAPFGVSIKPGQVQSALDRRALFRGHEWRTCRPALPPSRLRCSRGDSSSDSTGRWRPSAPALSATASGPSSPPRLAAAGGLFARRALSC